MAEKVIIDTDPAIGVPFRDVDDGLALGLALRSPELEVVGISVTYGNTSLPLAMRSAGRLLKIAGREDIPVLAGASSRRSLGKSTEASEFIEHTLASNPGGVSLLTLGPVTNPATAEMLSPGILGSARRTVAMGGAIFGPGIMPPFFRAEFNFWNDPPASSIFVKSAKDLTIVPAELTMSTALGWKYMERLRNSADPLAEFIHRNSLLWYLAMSAARLKDGFPPHDPLAAGWMLQPRLYETREASIIITEKGPFRGECRRSKKGTAVNVATGVQLEEFLELLVSRLCAGE